MFATILRSVKNFVRSNPENHNQKALQRRNSRRSLLRGEFGALQLQKLEDRLCPATWTVSALTDTGTGAGNSGDLRYCVNNAASGDSIVYSSTLVGTLTLGSSLDVTGKTLSITGSTFTIDTITASTGVTAFTIGNAGNLTITNLDINNCDVTGADGGAINEAFGATVGIYGCGFSGNKAEDGGAIFCQAGSALTIGNYSYVSGGMPNTVVSNFYDNSAVTNGGAIAGSDFSLTVINSGTNTPKTEFYSNSANGAGGAIYLDQDTAGTSAVVSSAYFTENSAGLQGGAMWVDGSNTQVTLANDVFDYNSASEGGAFYINDGSVTFDSTTTIVSYNTGSTSGGGFLINGGTLSSTTAFVVSNNTAPAGMGNGIYLDAAAGVMVGGGPTYINDGLNIY